MKRREKGAKYAEKDFNECGMREKQDGKRKNKQDIKVGSRKRRKIRNTVNRGRKERGEQGSYE